MPTTPTKTVLFTDAVDTGCGQATSQTGPFYCPVDQLVYIDLGFMQALEQQLIGKPTDLAEQYIIAHEYGHHVQNLLGINSQVQQAQQNDPGRANQYSVAMELQADCFAGMWVGDVASRGLLESADEINEALERRGRRRRRPHPGKDAGPNRQGGVDARFRRAAPDVVHAGLQLRRSQPVRHVQRAVVLGTSGMWLPPNLSVDPLRGSDAEPSLPQGGGDDPHDPEACGEAERDIEAGRADQVPVADHQIEHEHVQDVERQGHASGRGEGLRHHVGFRCIRDPADHTERDDRRAELR